MVSDKCVHQYNYHLNQIQSIFIIPEISLVFFPGNIFRAHPLRKPLFDLDYLVSNLLF